MEDSDEADGEAAAGNVDFYGKKKKHKRGKKGEDARGPASGDPSSVTFDQQRGSSGPGFIGGGGEKKLELDRRVITDRIAVVERALEGVARTRRLHREARRKRGYAVDAAGIDAAATDAERAYVGQQSAHGYGAATRESIPTVCLVGYTNAGKSSLASALTRTRHKFEARDQLFATLDSTAHLLRLPSSVHQKALLVDTVGFVADLPHALVASFRATLEEVLEADLLLHVRDPTHPESELQRREVLRVLREIGVAEDTLQHRTIEVWNKCDLLQTGGQTQYEDTCGAESKAERGTGAGARTGKAADAMESSLPQPATATTAQLPPGALLVSAKTGEGLSGLLRILDTSIQRITGRVLKTFLLPIDLGPDATVAASDVAAPAATIEPHDAPPVADIDIYSYIVAQVHASARAATAASTAAVARTVPSASEAVWGTQAARDNESAARGERGVPSAAASPMPAGTGFGLISLVGETELEAATDGAGAGAGQRYTRLCRLQMDADGCARLLTAFPSLARRLVPVQDDGVESAESEISAATGLF
jgi:GTP-binding protein EngB required for normal cell division